MAIRPSSLQRQYDEYWSGDPAFVQPNPKATEAELVEHGRRWRVARQTGNVAELLVDPQAKPTKFVLRPLPGSVFRRLADLVAGGKIGNAEVASLAFRAALVDVVNGGDECPKIELRPDRDHPELGKIAPLAVADYFDEIDKSIVGELSNLIQARAVAVDPLSSRG